MECMVNSEAELALQNWPELETKPDIYTLIQTY